MCLCLKSKYLISRQITMRSVLIKFIFIVGFIQISGVVGIQNAPTTSRTWRQEPSASRISTDDYSTSMTERDLDDLTKNFESTQPAHRLETSRSINNFELDVDSTQQFTSPGGNFDPAITASKNIEHIEGNNIEVKPAEYYDIASTKDDLLSGEGQGAPQGQAVMSGPHHPTGSGQRQGRQEAPRIYSDRALPTGMQTVAAGNRQANPDIQDIITGIVKLLNGNVNVAANSIRVPKPPQATRINNRGPPRISDLPPLPPDFDTPGMNPPPLPADPYPFEKPPAPERPSVNQLPPSRPYINGGPMSESNNRPWPRPILRPGNNRRPIPPYKPMPPHQESPGLFNDNKTIPPPFDTTTNHSADDKENQPADNNEQQQSNVTKDEQVTKKPAKYQPPLKQDKVVAENTLILGSDLQPIPIPTHENSVKPVPPRENSNASSKFNVTRAGTNAETQSIVDEKHLISVIPRNSTVTTLGVETSSSVQVIESTRTTIEIQPSIVPLESNTEATTVTTESIIQTTILESSRIDEETSQGTYHISTPTDGLMTRMTTRMSSVEAHRTTPAGFYKNTATINQYSYRPRPGIVIDDTLDYVSPGLVTQRPYAPPRRTQLGDIFDVTVSAVQGPGGGNGENIRIPVNQAAASDVILTSAVDGQGYVSIDGKRTYMNLFDNTNENVAATKSQIQPSRTQGPSIVGTGYAVPQVDTTSSIPARVNGPPRRPTFHRRPTQPPVRIDTCIVGDTSTCDASQHEACATIQGVSACHCKPGYARLLHTLPCKRVVSIVMSIRVDRIYDWKIVWDREFSDKDSESYQTIAYESNRAIESAVSMTPFSDEYMGSSINGVYQGDVSKGQGGVFVNATLKLAYESRTARPTLAGELQRHLLGVIHRRNNNVGNSAVFVDTPVGSISSLQDLDECASSELNDCNSSAVCTNNWGGFICTCKPGLKDPHRDDPNLSGRNCLSCPSSHCNNRGTCSYQNNNMQCSCTGNNYGAQCEIDGEVLGVAIGASVAALIIIILTLVCLVMWSRRWSREQKAASSPVYGYMQGGIPGTLPGTLARVGSVGTLASMKHGPPPNIPPYLWGHIADRMATANLYATEPMGPTRPSSAVFGYPTMNCHGTLPPIPLPRLQAPPRNRHRHQPDPDSSDSELQDRDRADLIPQHSGFHVPRPKSRSSLANQSGIYYDVEYDQGDAQHLSKNNIPMSTYSKARPYYRT